jgi:uncharacterized protein YndB with AHSA1/START domain
MQVRVQSVIAAPPETVFAVATEIARWPEFIAAIERVEVLTPGPVAVGTRFRETRTMFGRSATEEMTVAEIDPPLRLVLTAHNHGTAYRAEHLFAPQGAGTSLTLTFDGRPQSLPARLFAPIGYLMLGTVRRQLASDLADLGREAERRHKQAAAAR